MNDTLGGAPVTPAQLTVTLTSPGGLTGATLDPQGRLTVPANTTPGAYTLTYQGADKTVADADVEKLRNKIIRSVEAQLGATVRKG